MSPQPYPDASYPTAWDEANMEKAPDVPVNDALNEVQSVWNDATGDTFTLTLVAEETADIAFDAAAAQIKIDLELLANVTTVEVTGTGDSAGDPWLITFVAPAGDVALLVADDTLLTGETIGTTIAVVTEGDGALTVSDVSAGQGPL